MKPHPRNSRPEKIIDILLLERALACSSCGITVADTQGKDLPLVYVNEAFERITGYSRDEILGQNCRFLQNEDRDQPALEEVRAAVREGRSCDVVLRNYRKDGSLFHNELHLAPVRSAEGHITHFIGVQTEVTRRVEAEHERDVLIERLQHINEELDQFTQVVSHDLRAPLRGVQSFVEIITKEMGSSIEPKMVEYLGLINGSVDRMYHLIHDLLQYASSGRSPAAVRPVNLNRLVDELRDTLDVPETLHIEVPEPLPVLTGQETELYQVMQNLVSNAVKYNDQDDGRIRITAAEEDSHWKISVSDNGPGIDEKYHEKIFGLFERIETGKNVDSTGVGLALVRKIVEANDGRTGVISTPGEGATFWFTWAKTP